jgi:hypothetical protein
LGKELAKRVLQGEGDILQEAVGLLGHGHKDVRAGAAKIIEQVALADPEMAAGVLPSLLPFLEVPEPQTRWMIMHTLGICAELDPETAMEALAAARIIMEANSGACLWGSTIIYLGHLGALSESNCRQVFPILEKALTDIPRQTKRVLESFLLIVDCADVETLRRITDHTEALADDERSGVRTVARRLRRRVAQTPVR